MKKETGILLTILFLISFDCYSQQADSLAKKGQSFVMDCYYKKYSDSVNFKPNYDYISDYRKCKTCKEDFENRKIVQKVFNAQITNEPLPYRTSKYGPDYYSYYRGMVTRKYPSVVIARLLSAL